MSEKESGLPYRPEAASEEEIKREIGSLGYWGLLNDWCWRVAQGEIHERDVLREPTREQIHIASTAEKIEEVLEKSPQYKKATRDARHARWELSFRVDTPKEQNPENPRFTIVFTLSN